MIAVINFLSHAKFLSGIASYFVVRLHHIDVACCYMCCMFCGLCVLGTWVSYAKMDKLIKNTT